MIMKKIFVLIWFCVLAVPLFSQDPAEDRSRYQYFDTINFPDGIKSITVYIKPDCGRCESVTSVLDDAVIPYAPVIIDNDSVNRILEKKFAEAVKTTGIGWGMKYPVLEINGILYYVIANHWYFVNQLKDFYCKE